MRIQNEDGSIDVSAAYRTATLEKIKIGLQRVVSEQLLDPQVVMDVDKFLADEVRFTLRGYIWGEHVGETTITYPEDWFQGFKERHFPDWLLDRYPVRYTVHEITCNALYPNFRISVPNQEYRLRVNVGTHIFSEYQR